MKRLVLATIAVVALLGITVSAVLADWPTSCVELNDIIEAHRGNDHNVGIYQRVHGDQAEAVCRSEHRDAGYRFGARPFEVPSKSDPAAYTQAYVERAIDRYNTQGLQATLDYYNSPASIDGQWYVFVFDESDVLIAHATVPSLVGLHARDVRGPDGFPSGLQVVANATADGAWTSYTSVHPESGATQTKHSWAVRHDGLVFGSGWYEQGPSKDQPDTYTQAFVQRGITLYDDVGLDAVLDYYNTEQSLDGAWYLFVFDENDVLRTHAATPALVDLPAREVTGPDLFPTGLQVVADATPEGAWTSYSWVNPATGETQTKHSWVIRHDGLVFGSGWYEPGPSKDDLPSYAQALVQRAVHLHESLGTDETLAYYNTPESADGTWYVFVLEDRDGDLYTVANANRPDLVGTTRVRIDANGFNYGEGFAAVTEQGGGAWVSYLFTHPQTREDAPKHTWIVRRDNLLFGAGWYEPAVSKDDPAAYTQAVVQRALNFHEMVGRDATLAYYNTPDSIDGQWYVFILEEDLTRVAHAFRPELVGTNRIPRIDFAGKRYDPQFLATDEAGHWVDYAYFDPSTGSPGYKHTWIVRRDGLLFGSGWYEPIDRNQDPGLFTRGFVQQALNRYDAEGRQAAIDYYNTPESIDGPWYVFIVDETGTMVAHAARPERLGLTLDDLVDARGFRHGAVFATVPEGEDLWVSYWFINPTTGQPEQKHSWVVRRDGLLFGSGWYEG